MFALTLRSIGHRPGRFTATLLATFLGAAVIMMFNSLHDTAQGDAVDTRSADSLTLTGAVVGGYGTLLVFFAVASTLTVNVRQRQEEIHLLRCTGATPAQISRMVVGEAAAIALVGTLLAVYPARLAGRALLAEFRDSGQISDTVSHAFGLFALTSGFGITLLASMGAAFLAVRRGVRAASGTARTRRGRGRAVAAGLTLLAGAAGVASTFAMEADAEALMAPAAYGAIVLSAGFALVSPSLLRFLLGRFEPTLTAFAGASSYLAVHIMRQRAAQLAGVLMPLVLFTGMATATLYIQAVESDALKASGVTKSYEDKTLETLNFVVVGIIVVFSCLMLINSLYADTSYRSREFGQHRLAGATDGQVLGTLALEALALTVIGVFFGTVAGVAGILSFSKVRTDVLVPDQGLGIWLAIVGLATGATLLTSVGTAVRMLRVPAVSAVAVAA
ncbi:FtsX-like permease family protein [Streptomyces sp. NPDC049687]|uniref:FtsX-like permease family protein n=1 Tax=Streptomyces sp. NPDC049687 TaxID=3365596 RepID=UPI00379B9B93